MTDEELEGIVKAKVKIDNKLKDIKPPSFVILSEESKIKREVEKVKLEKELQVLDKKIQEYIDGE